MVYNKVNAVDATNEYAKINGITTADAHNELTNYGILEVVRTETNESGSTKSRTVVYDLSRDAKIALQNGKNLVDYLKDKLKKEQQDQQIKNLQYQDLLFKVEKLNQEQLTSLAAQRERNKQLTILGIISVVFSIIALLKSFG
jgi:hypothetical protein